MEKLDELVLAQLSERVFTPDGCRSCWPRDENI